MTAEALQIDDSRRWPEPRAVVRLLKPITWFAPMWALACGMVASGVSLVERWPFVVGAIVLAGPLLCATSQIVNDWFDRHVDAINEPDRPIPSGRVPGRWGLGLAFLWSGMGLVCAAWLGPWVLGAGALGVVLAWVYSMPPFRLKQSGWAGVIACGLSYESLPWFTGAAALEGGLPSYPSIAIALLYGVGAFGIMILNDFKAVEGDTQMGVRSVPVQLGVAPAARVACAVMAAPQLVVIGLLVVWSAHWHAFFVAAALLAQGGLMVRLVGNPKKHAAWYNATGTTLYVLGMMVSAFAIRSMA